MSEVTDPELLKQLNMGLPSAAPPPGETKAAPSTDEYTSFPGSKEIATGASQGMSGVAQGLGGALADIRSKLPDLPFESERTRKIKQEGVQRVQNWAAQPETSKAQGVGRMVGGALPYFAVGGPSSLAALSTRWLASRVGAIPGPALHVAGRLMGVSPSLLHAIQHGLRTGALYIGGAAPPVAGSIRAGTRTPTPNKGETKPKEEPSEIAGQTVDRSRKGNLVRRLEAQQ
jgi:hypothetical protein